MLQITIPLGPEGWDEEKEEFVSGKEKVLCLEHSLISLSKWESKWCKPFLTKGGKTSEETLDYIKCMTLTQNVNSEVYDHITSENIREVEAYIAAPQTATVFYDDKVQKSSRETVTAELIYYWMISLNIPFECQKWHLNRLLTLIRVCNVKNAPPKKMNKRDITARNARLNAMRRQQFNSKG